MLQNEKFCSILCILCLCVLIKFMSNEKQLPQHLAIIMDGNGRWAKKRFLPRVFGHRAGVETVRKIVKYTGHIGISYLTLYAFSSENWKRSLDEVQFLMNLLKHYLEKELDFLHENQVRLKFIGDTKDLSSDIIQMMHHAENYTAQNTGLTLVLAINYGAHAEITTAIRNIVTHYQNNPQNDVQNITPAMIESYLNTAFMPAPDLIIRTAGEQRLSNFLLWQAAYSEFYFTDILWPDFDESALEIALDNYTKRERRYGGLI